MAKNNLKQATKKAQHESLVDSLFNDSVGLDEVESFVQIQANEIVEGVVSDFIYRVKKDINSVSPSMIVTGQIEDITLKTNNDDTIDVEGFAQVVLQSRGVSGTVTKRDTQHEYTDKKPPLNSLISWIKERGLNSVNQEFFGGEQDFSEVDLNSDKEIRKIAFALQNSIFLHGYPSKGNNYWDSNVKILEQDLLSKVTNNITDLLTYHITNQFGQSIHDKPKK